MAVGAAEFARGIKAWDRPTSDINDLLARIVNRPALGVGYGWVDRAAHKWWSIDPHHRAVRKAEVNVGSFLAKFIPAPDRGLQNAGVHADHGRKLFEAVGLLQNAELKLLRV